MHDTQPGATVSYKKACHADLLAEAFKKMYSVKKTGYQEGA